MSLSQADRSHDAESAQSLIAGRLTTAGIVSASVATLTQGVLRTMYWTKLKLAAVAMLLILTGSAALVAQATAQKLNSGRGIVSSHLGGRKAAEPRASSDAAIDVEMLDRAWAAAIPGAMLRSLTGFSPTTSRALTRSGPSSTRHPTCPTSATGLSPTNRIDLDEFKTRIFGETAVATSRIKIPTVLSRVG